MGLRDRMTPKVVGTGEGLEAAAPVAGQRFDYRAETLRSKLIGDRMEGGEVERLLNQRAGEGWQLKSVTETEVKGRIGPGGTMDLLLIFERPVGGS